MRVGLTKLNDTSHTYTYRGEATGRGGGVHQNNCDVGKLNSLVKSPNPINAYKLSVRACFSPASSGAVCSSPSNSTKTWTRPMSTSVRFRLASVLLLQLSFTRFNMKVKGLNLGSYFSLDKGNSAENISQIGTQRL